MSLPAQISFEFFPPRTEKATASLLLAAKKLSQFPANYFSVTFGAGGSTKEGTLDTVLTLQEDMGMKGVPHLSCMGSSKQDIAMQLEEYKLHGIKSVVALRGDLPSGMANYEGELTCARDLVTFIREQFGDDFYIEVAAYPEFHPQARDPQRAMQYFKEKVLAGANGAITQYFYNPDAYFAFMDDCARYQIDIPITPGIMPIMNFEQLDRFSKMCGAEIPAWIRKRLYHYRYDANATLQLGVEIVSQLCHTLLKGGAPGLHFYTLNRSKAVSQILHALGMKAEATR